MAKQFFYLVPLVFSIVYSIFMLEFHRHIFHASNSFIPKAVILGNVIFLAIGAVLIVILQNKNIIPLPFLIVPIAGIVVYSMFLMTIFQVDDIIGGLVVFILADIIFVIIGTIIIVVFKLKNIDHLFYIPTSFLSIGIILSFMYNKMNYQSSFFIGSTRGVFFLTAVLTIIPVFILLTVVAIVIRRFFH